MENTQNELDAELGIYKNILNYFTSYEDIPTFLFCKRKILQSISIFTRNILVLSVLWARSKDSFPVLSPEYYYKKEE